MRPIILKFVFTAALAATSLDAAEITFIEPNTKHPLPVKPEYLDEKGRATVLFYAQCDQHLAPFIKPHHVSVETETKALRVEEDIKRALFISLQKFKPDEQSNIIRSISLAIASGRYDQQKLMLLLNQDIQKGGNFLDVLNTIANSPHSTDRKTIAKILAHEESHYATPESLKEFHNELKKVYTQCRAELTPAP